MSELLSSVVGGGGSGFQSEGITFQNITSGQTGELISIPEVSGKVYRIFLLATSTPSAQPGISLITNGNTIESEKILIDSSPSSTGTSSFGISRIINSTTVTLGRGFYNVVECSSFSIEKNAGNTTEDIDLSYETGEYK